MTNDDMPAGDRRDFLKNVVLGSAALTGAATGLFSKLDIARGDLGMAQARAADARVKMAFVQFQPHTVSTAWSTGIQEVLPTQQIVDYQALDGQAKLEVQVSLMDTLISQGVSVIFLQPVDSVGVAPSIAKAKRAGISVITLNIDATEPHAAHVDVGAIVKDRILFDRQLLGEVITFLAPALQ